MASRTPLMAFLRPLSLPRASTLRFFLRLSTSSQPRRQQIASQGKEGRITKPSLRTNNVSSIQKDPSLMASRTASPTYPPPSMKSMPRPKESRASRRTSHPKVNRPYPTRQPSHHQPSYPKLIPEAVTPLSPAQCAPNLAYFITRTGSNQMPVYQERKRGGNLKVTRVRKIDGDPEVLRDELRETLRLKKKEDCVVNPVTRHVVMKGHFKPEVESYLRERMF